MTQRADVAAVHEAAHAVACFRLGLPFDRIELTRTELWVSGAVVHGEEYVDRLGRSLRNANEGVAPDDKG